MGILVAVNNDKFYIDKSYTASETMDKDENGERPDPGEISLLGSQVIEQKFTALEPTLQKVMIDFKAWEQKKASGTIYVEVVNGAGEVLGSAKKAVSSLVQSKSSVTTTFTLNVQLKVNETYTLVIRSEDVESEKGVFVYQVDRKGKVFSDLLINGEPADGRITMTFGMIHFSLESILEILGILLLSMVFVLIPFDRGLQWHLRKRGKDIDLNKLAARILFLVSVPMAFFIVQRYCGYGIVAFLKKTIGRRWFYNYFLYGMMWWLFYLIINRTKYVSVLLVGISSLFGLVNYFVWTFRGSPIMAADIASFGTAMDVADNYEYSLDYHSLWALAVTAAFICMVLSLKTYKGVSWKKRIAGAILFCIPGYFFMTRMLSSDYLKNQDITVSVWAPERNYAKNGQLLSFFMSYTYYVVDKPSDYSVKNVEQISERYQSDTAADDPEDMVKPNIIAIMNEAFSDLYVDGIETSEDYMPYIHSLTENTVKGDLYVSVLGGNTANTEFEFLTGCSMAFLPFRAIPYDTFIKDQLPSLTYTLKESGYVGNAAMHPAKAENWSRDEVYPLLGFDQFISIDQMESLDYVRNFVSDESDFNEIIKNYETVRETSDEPYYIFNVTMQNHGGYSTNQGMVDTEITITNDAQKDEAAEQYINLVKMTDDAFAQLTEYFAGVDEPTVIVMFGDHQPSLSTDTYESFFGKSKSSFTLEDTKNQYTVPYIIWANYDIEEGTADMSANYLSAYLMKTIGGNMTGYQKYLMDLYEQVPIITANCYGGADGKLYALDAESEYSDLVEEYQVIAYNDLFDSKNRVEEFFYLAE